MTPGSFLLKSSFTSLIPQATGVVIAYHYRAADWKALTVGVVCHYPADREAWEIGAVAASHYPVDKEPSGIEAVAVRHYPVDKEPSGIGIVAVRHYPAV